MSGQGMPVVFFCLATGAALGCLFLLFRGFAALLGLKKWGTAAMDLLVCCVCGGAVFLCALAVDSGRLRLYQAALQGLGAWAAVKALGPWIVGGARRLKNIFWKLWALLAGRMGFFREGKARGRILAKKLEKR